MEYYFTYITLNKINGKKYYGIHKTTNINDGYLGSGVLLTRAIKKYGKEHFIVIERNFFDTYEEAKQDELEFVNENIVESEEWYNVTTGGNSNKHNSITREKISKSMQGKIPWNKGKTYTKAKASEETKRKMSESRKGTSWGKHTEETKQILSEKKRGNRNPMYGRKPTREKTQKASEKLSGDKNPAKRESVRRKISESWKYREDVICPHCGKTSKNKSAMLRWHFDNCKERL